MTWFDAFRGNFGFSFYGEKRTPVTIDIQLACAIYACVLVSIATIIVAIGVRGKEVRNLIVIYNITCYRNYSSENTTMIYQSVSHLSCHL
jgi:hypothetical protein